MGKSHQRHDRRTGGRGRPGRTGPPDGAVYIGLVMIGVFAIGLWYILAGDTWRHGLIGYVIAMAVLVNLYTWRVYTGRRLLPWQRSLARLPLRCVGYGTRKGKPLEAAHDSSAARTMLMVSIATSVVVIALLSIWLIPQ